MFKRCRSLVPALIFLLAAAVSADQITVSYEFEYPRIETIQNIGGTFDQVQIENAPNGGKIGWPSLPARGAEILLPLGAEVVSVDVTGSVRELVATGLNVEPVAAPTPISLGPSAQKPPTPDPKVYSLNTVIPENRYEEIGVQEFRGYPYLVLKLTPVEYIPDKGELYFYPKLTVTVTTQNAGKSSDLFRGLPEDDLAIRAKVDNPDAADSYYAAAKSGTKSYDMLIITTDALASSFQQLKDYHDTTGILTEIVTTSTLGSSDPVVIRDSIRERYTADGISYVLIGGDDDVIPAKDLFVEAWSGSEYVEYSMPSDFFFACLDGNYNSDMDDRWGEPTDGRGSSDVDLVAEVYLGRASVGNTTEANRFVNKTIQYMNANGAYLKKAIMLGEYLGFGGLGDYGGYSKDEIVDGSSAHRYTTVGIPSDKYEIDRLYDMTWPTGDWPVSELKTRINAGLHIINHYGHSNGSYNMKMSSSYVQYQLINTDLFFEYSQGCMAGEFDLSDSYAEYLTIKTDYAAFAAILNARYGWGSGDTDGPSQRFDREFFDALFGEDITRLGPANHDSKEDNAYRIDESCMRWCTYELNLFGDPTVPIKGAASCDISNLPDSDGDGACDVFDNCPGDYNVDQLDSDGDMVGDLCDVCPYDETDDGDGDGLCGDVDNCPYVNNPDQTDSDSDGIGDSCDQCPGYDDLVDSDGDGVADGCDVCQGYDDFADSDSDGAPDSCDVCPGYNDSDDYDEDGVPDHCDICPSAYDPGQEDNNLDGIGDACCCEIRGDVSGNGNGPDIANLVYLVSYMFQGGPEPPCMAASDIDGDGIGPNIADLIYLVNHMFNWGPAPVPCPEYPEVF